jgi:peptidoglycan glycosyltransferase
VNAPLRRVSVAVMALFASLLAMANYRQVVQAGDLRDDPRNGRVLLRTYAVDRGAIAVEAGGKAQAVADSVETDGALKYLRRYPSGPVYAHVTGFASFVYGTTGIERDQDRVLSGEDDRLFVERLSDQVTGAQPEGGSVVLTLDPAAQAAAVAGLRGKRGAVVALDPRTGAVLAMASSPSYDPTVLSSHDPTAIRAAYDALVDDPGEPLANRAVERRSPPGSTFKLITAAAALSTGVATPTTVLDAPRVLTFRSGKPLQNFAGETCGSNGRQRLTDALATSCNTAFAKLGLRVGEQALAEQARAFGFGDTDLRLPQPLAPSRFLAPGDSDLAEPFLAQSSIGQYNVTATPLQMALVAAGIANQGEVMRPYLVREVQGPDLSRLDLTEPEVLSRAVSPAVAAQLTAMMEAVVTKGTGSRARIDGVRVAGKTGTAQGAQGQDPGVWFVGFAPADAPTVAVAVYLDRASGLGPSATGGRLAAPIAAAVMKAALR